MSAITADVRIETAEPVRARGYWEGVWLRFRRDRFALAAGVFIVLVILVGFIGSPLPPALLGPGPAELTQGAVSSTTCLPIGPNSSFTDQTAAGTKHFYFLLGGDSQL